MTIAKTQNGTELILALSGRLDTITSPELEAELRALNDVEHLTLDFAQLDYISSAGLRALMNAHKALKGKGGMLVINANEIVKEVFEVTGFDSILNIR